MPADLLAHPVTEGAVDGNDRVGAFFSAPRIAWILGVLTASTYFVGRCSFGPVWNDTGGLAWLLFESPRGRPPLDWEIARRLVVIGFGSIVGGGFRPLDQIATNFMLFGFRSLEPSVEMIAAVLIGTTAALVFFVAHRLLKDRIWALVATLLLMCAGPYVSADAVVISGFQTLVPLVLCGSLLCYWRYQEATSSLHRMLWLAALVACLVLGPWYREYTGLASLLVIAAETLRRRRPTWVIGLATLTLAHAVFPTAVLRLVPGVNLPLVSIFSIGNLGRVDHLAGTVHPIGLGDRMLTMMPNLKWDLGLYFLPLLPPTAIALAYGGFWLAAWRHGRVSHGRPLWGPLSGLHWLPVWGVLLAALSAGYFVSQLPYVTGWDGFGLAAAFGLGALGFAVDPLLGIWFLLSLLPFIVVFRETVHLLYVLVPASIIVAGGLARLVDESKRWPVFWRRALAGAIVVLFVDQALGAVAVWRVMRGIYGGELAAANEIRTRIPPNSIVVSNALSALEVELFSEGYFRTYYSVSAGVPPNRVADTDEVFSKLLAEHRARFYFLDIEHPFIADKSLYHSLKYVRDHSVPMRALGTIHTTSVRYLFLDPLKLLFDVPYVNFLGSPDLVNDFYDGPPLTRALFRDQLYATYRLYQAVGTKVDPWHPEGGLALVASDGAYNIVAWNGRYFAQPAAEGPIDFIRLLSRQYPFLLVGDSLEDVKRQIAASGVLPGARDGVTLIAEGYRGYNIVKWGDLYFGLPQSAGPVDAKRLLSDGRIGYIRGVSVEDVERGIDEFGDP